MAPCSLKGMENVALYINKLKMRIILTSELAMCIKCLTCHASGVGEHDDIVESPAVLGVWRIKRQVTGGLLPQIYQIRRMDHGHSKTAAALPLADGYVSRRAFVVALQEVHTRCKRQIPGNRLCLHSGLWVVSIFATAQKVHKSPATKQKSSREGLIGTGQTSLIHGCPSLNYST